MSITFAAVLGRVSSRLTEEKLGLREVPSLYSSWAAAKCEFEPRGADTIGATVTRPVTPSLQTTRGAPSLQN